MATLRDELRERFPGLSKSADEGGRSAACKLFCIECMGGSYKDAASCQVRECFLWAHAFKRQRQG